MVPDDTDSPAGRSVERKLRAAWHKERRYQHARGLSHFVVWAVPIILLSFVLDRLLEIPGWGRALLLVVDLATLGWVAWHYWLRYLRPYDETRVALEVESRHPDLRSLLVSYVQIGEDAAGDPHVSRAMIGAMRRQALDVTRPIDFRDILNYRELKRILVFSACVALFFSAISIQWRKHFGVFVARMLDPTSDLKYPTRTQVTPETKDLVVQQGKPVTLAAVARGVVPETGMLHYRPEDGDWEEIAVRAEPGDRFAYTFPEVYHSFTYRFHVYDDKTDVYQVEVVPAPRITAARVTLTYPAYTRLGTRRVETLNLRVPEETRIDWALHVRPAVAAAELVRVADEANPVALTLGADGGSAALSMTARQGFAYRFRWKEKAHGFVYDEEVQQFLQIDPDLAPEVEILQPLGNETATVRKTVHIKFHAKDDYGVASARIVYWMNDQPPGEQKPLPLEYKGQAIETYSWTLKNTVPKLKEGDTVHYAIEVADTFDGKGGPHVRRSKPRSLAIVSLNDYQRYVYDRLSVLTEELRRVQEVETEGSRQIKELRDDEDFASSKGAPTQPASRPAKGGDEP